MACENAVAIGCAAVELADARAVAVHLFDELAEADRAHEVLDRERADRVGFARVLRAARRGIERNLRRLERQAREVLAMRLDEIGEERRVEAGDERKLLAE